MDDGLWPLDFTECMRSGFSAAILKVHHHDCQSPQPLWALLRLPYKHKIGGKSSVPSPVQP